MSSFVLPEALLHFTLNISEKIVQKISLVKMWGKNDPTAPSK